MNTYITRVWMNNRNNFVISDDQAKHATAVDLLISEGGRKMESNVCTHELGTIVIVRSDAEGMYGA